MVNGSQTATIARSSDEHGGRVRHTVTIDLLWVAALALILLLIKRVHRSRHALAAAR